MNNDQKDKTEFEKLLEESDLDINQILRDKSGKTVNNPNKDYISVNVSHDDLYNENLNIEFSHRQNGIQNKVIHDLKSLKYKFKHTEILDLHGLTANEAELELNSFIKNLFLLREIKTLLCMVQQQGACPNESGSAKSL